MFQRAKVQAPSARASCRRPASASWCTCARRRRTCTRPCTSSRPLCTGSYQVRDTGDILSSRHFETTLNISRSLNFPLFAAIENKYKINATNIRFLYRKNKDGIVAKVDDDMLRHYCNEDVFLMQVTRASITHITSY